MTATPTARKYQALYGRRPTEMGRVIKRVIELSGFSPSHVYNVARGTRRSAAVEKMIEDVKAGKL